MAAFYHFSSCGVEIIPQCDKSCIGRGRSRHRAGQIRRKTIRQSSFSLHHCGMAQAIMNPEEVRRFAQELKRFNTEMQQRSASLQSRFTALGETWQDAEHEKFAAEFTTTMKAIKRFMEMSEQHTPFLLRKAQRIEEYLSQR
jgi:uncharacterized protein YukE